MNIFEFARENERAAEKAYLEMADNAGSKGLKTIFAMLAAMEKKHFEILINMEKSQSIKNVEFHPLKTAKDQFIKMQTSREKFKASASQTELYRKAQQTEKEAEEFYREKAKEAQDEGQKKVFIQIAEEEKKHFIVLDNIIDFVTGPSAYLENAEFNQIGSD